MCIQYRGLVLQCSRCNIRLARIAPMNSRLPRVVISGTLGGVLVGFLIGGAFYWLRGLLAARSAATAAAAAGSVDDVVIAADKLRYILKLDPGKAKGFSQLGYTLENADDLANVLRYSKNLIGEGTTKTVTEFGTKYEVVMQVIGANGREGLIKVVWQVDHGSTVYRFITSIPKPF